MLSLGLTGCCTQSLSNFILLEMFLNMFMGSTYLAKLQLIEKSNVSTTKTSYLLLLFNSYLFIHLMTKVSKKIHYMQN